MSGHGEPLQPGLQRSLISAIITRMQKTQLGHDRPSVAAGGSGSPAVVLLPSATATGRPTSPAERARPGPTNSLTHSPPLLPMPLR